MSFTYRIVAVSSGGGWDASLEENDPRIHSLDKVADATRMRFSHTHATSPTTCHNAVIKIPVKCCVVIKRGVFSGVVLLSVVRPEGPHRCVENLRLKIPRVLVDVGKVFDISARFL